MPLSGAIDPNRQFPADRAWNWQDYPPPYCPETAESIVIEGAALIELVEGIVENSVAAADDGSICFERAPSESESGREIVLIHGDKLIATASSAQPHNARWIGSFRHYFRSNATTSFLLA